MKLIQNKIISTFIIAVILTSSFSCALHFFKLVQERDQEVIIKTNNGDISTKNYMVYYENNPFILKTEFVLFTLGFFLILIMFKQENNILKPDQNTASSDDSGWDLFSKEFINNKNNERFK